jgi:large subunit ribosomal protein L22
MEVVATAKYIHQSPRKVRLVTSAVSSLTPAEAMARLRLVDKKASQPVIDVLQSAVANATHNFKLDESTLRIRTLEVNEGPTLKRMSPRSRGRASTMLRRTAHIRVVLTDEPVVLGKRRQAAELAKQQSGQSWKGRKASQAVEDTKVVETETKE